MSPRLPRSVRPFALLVPVSCLLLSSASALALSQSSPTNPSALPEPYSPWGTITTNGESASDGLLVTASVSGVGECASTTTANGYYGLDVPGDDPDTTEKDGGEPGDTVVFAVDGCPASPTGLWSPGTSERIDLSVTFPTWYQDSDDDGYGNPAVSQLACSQPDGYVSDDTDCDDANAGVNPGADETIADGIDQDCNGGEVCYLDGDDDGYRPDATSTTGSADLDCSDDGEAGSSDPTGDCNDGNAGINPGATEIPDDTIDQDCDGADATLCIVDGDTDGYGTALGTTVLAPDGTCDTAQGESTSADDCDDTDPSIFPGAAEVWYDGVDQDCDGGSDYDQDGDSFESSSYGGTDCDDTDDTIYPGATEACDGIDNDCDGQTDEGFIDTDDDGDADCVDDDDDDDGTDDGDDCAPFDDTQWHLLPAFSDNDGDTYGTGHQQQLCCGVTLPPGYADNPDDCDDADPAVNPGASEVCNGIDDDCDTLTDEGFTDFDDDGDADCVDDDDDDDGTDDADDCAPLDDTQWQLLTGFADDDGDTYGSSASQDICSGNALPDGYAESADDCDDTDPAVNPDASEVCNGIDDDCDTRVDDDDPDCTGQPTWYADDDEDGYGDPALGVQACSQPASYADNADDCDDSDAAVNPDATEVCNGTDDDCDTRVDDDDPDCTGQPTWYADTDDDGFGDPLNAVQACTQPAGHVADNTDCDDTDDALNPGANEICNGIDDDCDGDIDADDDDCAPPTAHAGGPYTGLRTDTVTLDGSSSYDSDGTIATYEWLVDALSVQLGPTPTYPLRLSGYTLGDHTVTLIPTDDDHCTAVATTTLTVLNAPPMARDDTATVEEDSVDNAIDVLDNDTDPDPGATLSLTSVGHPDNGSATNNTTHVAYTPHPDFCGTDALAYTVSDGSGGTDSATVTITVTCVNDPPVAKDDSATTHGGTSVEIDLVANDFDIDGQIDPTTVNITTRPTHGSLATATDGTATYTPDTDYIGDDSFAYTVDDDQGKTSNQAVVSVAVEAPVQYMTYLPLVIRAH